MVLSEAQINDQHKLHLSQKGENLPLIQICSTSRETGTAMRYQTGRIRKMGDKIYTRTGIVRPMQQENNNRGYNNQFYQDRDLKLRTYRFPLHENNTLEIRLTIPEGATKNDMLEAVEHMKVAAGFME